MSSFTEVLEVLEEVKSVWWMRHAGEPACGSGATCGRCIEEGKLLPRINEVIERLKSAAGDTWEVD